MVSLSRSNEARVMMPFDEAHYNRAHQSDQAGPWDPQEAFARLVSERLKIRQPGATVADKAAERRGFREHPVLGTAAQVQAHEQQLVADLAERNERSAASLRESGEAAARARAANQEHHRRTGQWRRASL